MLTYLRDRAYHGSVCSKIGEVLLGDYLEIEAWKIVMGAVVSYRGDYAVDCIKRSGEVWSLYFPTRKSLVERLIRSLSCLVLARACELIFLRAVDISINSLTYLFYQLINRLIYFKEGLSRLT